MKVVLLVLSAAVVVVVKGSDVGFASSYNSVSGKQYHPMGWNKEIYPQHIPVIGKDGVPEETPEVIAAKHHFYAEYSRAAALAAQHPDPHDGQYVEKKYWAANNGWSGADESLTHGQSASAWEVNSGLSNHAPVETYEVQAAKASHFQAHANALSRSAAHKHGLYRRSASEWSQPKYEGPIHVPHITAHGVPADTPEVQKAKLNHLQILGEASARAHASGYVEDHSAWKSDDKHGQAYGPPQNAAWPSTPTNVDYKVHHVESPKWHGPEHHPVIDHNGVPVDTHEVQHARKAHLAALAAESSKHAGWEGAQKKW